MAHASRINDMQTLLEQVQLDNEQLRLALERIKNSQKATTRLSEYYHSRDWLEDSKHSVGQPVLNQDAIYEALEQRDVLLSQINAEVAMQLQRLS